MVKSIKKSRAKKCVYGKLKSPVRSPATGYIRRCKLKKKSKRGMAADKKSASKEFHEVRARKLKRAKRKTTRKKKKR